MCTSQREIEVCWSSINCCYKYFIAYWSFAPQPSNLQCCASSPYSRLWRRKRRNHLLVGSIILSIHEILQNPTPYTTTWSIEVKPYMTEIKIRFWITCQRVYRIAMPKSVWPSPWIHKQSCWTRNTASIRLECSLRSVEERREDLCSKARIKVRPHTSTFET